MSTPRLLTIAPSLTVAVALIGAATPAVGSTQSVSSIEIVTGDAKPVRATIPMDTRAAVISVHREQPSEQLKTLFLVRDWITDSLESDPNLSRHVVEVGIDFEAGKVAVVTTRDDPDLHRILAAHGDELVYLRVKPDESRPTTGGQVSAAALPTALPKGTRQTDYGPWSGGAKFRLRSGATPASCTTGFPWIIKKPGSSKKYILTAGHCFADGGWSWANDSTKLLGGFVTKDKLENWHRVTGTQKISRQGGEYDFNGDLALIPASSSTSIYVGGPISSKTKQVSGANFTFVNDEVCTGGAVSGEICGWKVTGVFKNIPYSQVASGRERWARNVAVAKNSSKCTVPGDSGGPVYRNHIRNSVHAHGIISGGQGRVRGQCTLVFTDIWRATDLWGGGLNIKSNF